TEFPAADYAMCNWYVSTHPESMFVQHLVAARPSPGRRHTLRDNELAMHTVRTGQSARRRLTSVQELREALQSVFGLNLPQTPELDRVLARVAHAKGDAPGAP